MDKNFISSPLPVDRLEENFFAVLNTKITRRMAAGADVIRMDIGSPDLPPAPHILEALVGSTVRSDSHGYQSHRGTAALRQAWIEMYRRLYGVVLSDEMVLTLIGSKEGIFHFSSAWLNPGDVVLVPDPGYQTYNQAARFARAEVFFLPLLPQQGYLPRLEAVPQEIAAKARILWLNYPNNPTGAVAPLAFFRDAVEFCREHGILLCHDAAYGQVTFDGYQAPSVLQVPGAAEVAIELSSLSKLYNMAGWRVGFAAGQPQAIAALSKLKTHADSGLFLPVMEAAVSALVGDQAWVEERNEVYRHRRDIMVNGLQEMGLVPTVPKAALYVWCPVPQGLTSAGFVLSLLENADVSLAPGTIFGAEGEGYVRISLTQPEERIRKAVERMGAWMESSDWRLTIGN
jgi:LL-diaminopimelate aminotransferase